MSLDEKLFGIFWKYQKKVFSEKIPEHALFLDKIEDRLTILASMLFGNMTKVKKGAQYGGFVGETLFCPPHVALSEFENENIWAYLYHLCFAYTATKLGYHYRYENTNPLQRTLISVVMAPTVIHSIDLEFEGLCDQRKDIFSKYAKTIPATSHPSTIPQFLNHKIRAILRENHQHASLHSASELLLHAEQLHNEMKNLNLSPGKDKLFFPPFFSLVPLAVDQIILHKTSSQKTNEISGDIKTTLKTDPKDVVKMMSLENEKNDYNPATLLMESVKTADIFKGGMKRVDGSDELSDHAEALSELDLREVVRTDHKTESIFKADMAYDIVGDGQDTNTPISSTPYHYHEWNYRKKTFMKNWCCVYEKEPKLDPTEESPSEFLKLLKTSHQKQIDQLKSKIQSIALSRQWKSRQREGDEIDIDGFVQVISELKAKESPTEKVYRKKRKAINDVAVTILLDASLSSDAWVEGKRIMDIAKETIAVIQEAVKDTLPHISIMAFNGKTRQQCEYHIIKDFHQGWSNYLERLLAVKPDGYTRIGTALRHSIKKIHKINTHKKIIIIVSDGQPTDYDVYEGKHGIQDVRQAVREAKQKNVDVFSLAIDREAKFYFPQMFGKNNFRILSHPNQLADHFVDLFTRVM